MIRFFYLIIFILSFFHGFSQSNTFPNVELETKNERIINSSIFNKKLTPKIIVYWLTTNRNSIELLNALELKKDFLEKNYSSYIISISLDKEKHIRKAISFINSNNWTFDSYLEPNAESIIELNGQNVPFILVLNESGKIVYRTEGYDSNTLNKIEEDLIKISNK